MALFFVTFSQLLSYTGRQNLNYPRVLDISALCPFFEQHQIEWLPVKAVWGKSDLIDSTKAFDMRECLYGPEVFRDCRDL